MEQQRRDRENSKSASQSTPKVKFAVDKSKDSLISTLKDQESLTDAGQRGRNVKQSQGRQHRVRDSHDKNRSEELALAVSIILANLSCDQDFLYILLGVQHWKPIQDLEGMEVHDLNQKAIKGDTGAGVDVD